MEATVLLSFKLLSQPDLILFTDNVIHQTTTQTLFESLKPFVDPVVVGYDVFRVSFNQASNGTYLFKVDRDKKHKELLTVLEALAKAVNTFAKGDRDIIITSGFKPSGDTQTITELLAPQNFEVFNLKPKRSVQLNWDKVEGRLNYALEMRVVGEETWKTVAFPTVKSYIFTDLPRGAHLEFRIRALGTKSMVSPWSAIIDIFVD
jgi:hypothetical protein